ncbi:MAG: phosphogluconate dehydrogenase (NAD(+)-dependent, decarboxylating) [Chloroflexia bacterium]
MEIGFMGLGRMGENMVRRLLRGNQKVVAWNRSKAKTDEVAGEGAVAAYTPADLVKDLSPRRVIWLMVPAGGPVDDLINELVPLLDKGDILIDGGNSNFRDSIRRHDALKEKGIDFLDIGTSGGIWGLQIGYCMMVGGDEGAFAYVEPLLKTLAPENGYIYAGASGAGHFTKMVHNGIEYAMLQAYGEGFEIIKQSQFGSVDLAKLSETWQHGSVIRSWMLDLAVRAFTAEPDLASIRGYVEDSGEGRWTVIEAINENVPAPVITLSLLARFSSRQKESFSAKVIAALRNEFGGHAVQLESGGSSGVAFSPDQDRALSGK